jgi:hypothetical protein
MSDKFSIQNGMKQGNALSPLLYNFSLEYAMKLNGTHQLLAYADDVNLLGDYVDTIY